MDNLTHSLVGLTLSKAGLERLSPYATPVCVIAANAPDADSFVLLFGDRWTALQHHRGITHSIIGTIGIGLLIPILALAIEQIVAAVRKRRVKIRFLYLTAASLIAAATHPLLDWTNNYGVRPFLPWSGRWFYGDFVFIMDPYIWLVLGGAAFLLTSNTRWKIIAWGALAALLLTIIVLVSRQRGLGGIGVTVAAAVWIAGLAGLIFAKTSNLAGRAGSSLAVAGLAILALYWGGLSLLHGLALSNTQQSAQAMAGERNESLVKTAAMPTAANPFRWQSLAETDRATYKFSVGVANSPARSVERFEKPQGWAAQLVEVANRDRRARILLEFSRFPVEQVADPNCVSRTLVQIADLRYTEPGVARGNFSTNIPVDCPAR